MSTTPSAAYLIVNADDYGCFHCVSRGILEAASRGIVTATGVFANAGEFTEKVAGLADVPGLDVGVHLNLTHGVPLTDDMRKRLSRWSGRFPGKFSAALAITSGAIGTKAVRAEWRAQIERCLECGLRVKFLNSHEHVHMLPLLLPVTRELAEDYDIVHVRFSTSKLTDSRSGGALLRSALIKALGILNRSDEATPAADFLGMEVSGRLDARYLQSVVPRLRPGRIYELMCHPGKFDPQEIKEPSLLRYHDWEGELSTLTSPTVRELLDRCGVRLIGFRQLETKGGQLVARQEPLA